MTTSDEEVRLALLDQWHVDVLVPADMDDATSERVRNDMDASLRQWATGARPGLSGVFVRVEQ